MWSGVTVMAHNLATSVFHLSRNSLHSFMQSAHNRSKPLLENLGGTPAQLCYGAGSRARQKQPIFGSGWMHEKAAATQWGSINTVQRKLFWGVGGCERDAGKNPHWVRDSMTKLHRLEFRVRQARQTEQVIWSSSKGLSHFDRLQFLSPLAST